MVFKPIDLDKLREIRKKLENHRDRDLISRPVPADPQRPHSYELSLDLRGGTQLLCGQPGVAAKTLGEFPRVLGKVPLSSPMAIGTDSGRTYFTQAFAGALVLGSTFREYGGGMLTILSDEYIDIIAVLDVLQRRFSFTQYSETWLSRNPQ